MRTPTVRAVRASLVRSCSIARSRSLSSASAFSDRANALISSGPFSSARAAWSPEASRSRVRAVLCSGRVRARVVCTAAKTAMVPPAASRTPMPTMLPPRTASARSSSRSMAPVSCESSRLLVASKAANRLAASSVSTAAGALPRAAFACSSAVRT